MSDKPVTLPPKTAQASIHLASTVLDKFDRDETRVDKDSVYSRPRVDTSGIDFNEEELTEAQRNEVKGVLEGMSLQAVTGTLVVQMVYTMRSI